MRESANYSWIEGDLFKLGPDHILRLCIREDETHDILHECHDEPPRGHSSTKKTYYKILKASYY